MRESWCTLLYSTKSWNIRVVEEKYVDEIEIKCLWSNTLKLTNKKNWFE